MYNLLSKLCFYISSKTKILADTTDGDYNASVSPIYEFLDTFGPFLISMILGLGVIYCIVLMVKFVREESADERNKVKKQAINAVISFGVVVVLLVVLYAMRGTFTELMNDQG